MKIHQIYTHSPLRNFTYLIENEDQECICIDPFNAAQISAFINDNQLTLLAIINTHEHWDHIQGNDELISSYNCELWGHPESANKIPNINRFLKTQERIVLDTMHEIIVMNTPGHTFAHLCLLLVTDDKPIAIFTGDTIFNAGVGNCRNGGDPETLYQTVVEQFNDLADDIKLYPGHDYLENNLQFTLSLESDNNDATAMLERCARLETDHEFIVTTFAEERMVNTFFRLTSKNVRAGIEQKTDVYPNDDRETFLALRRLRDNW